jgi:hypothetical protein
VEVLSGDVHCRAIGVPVVFKAVGYMRLPLVQKIDGEGDVNLCRAGGASASGCRGHSSGVTRQV